MMEYQYGQNNENNPYQQGNNNYTYYHNAPYGSGPAQPPKKKKEIPLQKKPTNFLNRLILILQEI